MCYYIPSVLCLVFLAEKHVGSYLPKQGSNLHPQHWKAKSQPLDRQECPWMLY